MSTALVQKSTIKMLYDFLLEVLRRVRTAHAPNAKPRKSLLPHVPFPQSRKHEKESERIGQAGKTPRAADASNK
jgi:hypothetical protein